MAKIQLFCLPYAGGAALIFKKFEHFLPDHIELVAVELPGRGRRSGEPLYQHVEEAVTDIYEFIAPRIMNGKPYGIFGHSLGAMLGYEVAQKIIANKLPTPVHLFFSGRGVPHLRSAREKVYHLMDDEEFQRQILHLGGTPREFFEYPELLDYMLPVLRSDFKLSETAPLKTDIRPFECEISVFVGKEEDEIEAENVQGWMLHTTKVCTISYFNGGHFFINDEVETLAGIMNRKLTEGLYLAGNQENVPFKALR